MGPGENWFDRIRRELAACQVVVLMLSKRSVVRPWVNFEAGGAWLTNKNLIPVFFGNLTVDTLPRPYADLIAVDLRNDPYEVIQGVCRSIEPRPLPPPPIFRDGEQAREIREEPERFEDVP